MALIIHNNNNDNELSSLVSVVNVFSEDICMLFGLSKCNCVSLHRGKLVVTKDIFLPSGEATKQLPPDGVYRYLNQSDTFKTQMMKEKLISDYKGRLRKILRSHLTGSNIVQAINSYAVPVIRLD